MKRVNGSELIFISQIKRDGSGTSKRGVSKKMVDEYLSKEEFTVLCLSMSNRTYIAHGFNSYVVQFKDCKLLKTFTKLRDDRERERIEVKERRRLKRLERLNASLKK